MYTPSKVDAPRQPTGHPQPAEPDFTRPNSDKAKRLPLPGELQEPPRGKHGVREPGEPNPWNALVSRPHFGESGAAAAP